MAKARLPYLHLVSGAGGCAVQGFPAKHGVPMTCQTFAKGLIVGQGYCELIVGQWYSGQTRS